VFDRIMMNNLDCDPFTSETPSKNYFIFFKSE